MKSLLTKHVWFECLCIYVQLWLLYILFTLPLHAPVETLIYVVVLVHFTGNLPPLSQDHIPHCQWPCWHVWETVFICATCTPQPVYITDWNDDGTVTPFDITTDLCLWQELEYCEFFAGAARVFEEVKGAAYPSTAIDIEYMKNLAHEGRTNPFDFMTPCGFGSFVCKSVSNEVCLLEWICSLVFVGWILFTFKLMIYIYNLLIEPFLTNLGFRIAVWLISQCRPKNFFILLATVCSSWVHVNAGTSRRSMLLPEGREDLPYIQLANGMASRTLWGHIHVYTVWVTTTKKGTHKTHI